MASENLPENDGPSRDEWPTIGTRVSPDDLRRIDLARIYGAYQNRGELISAAVLEKVQVILDEHQPARAS